MPQRKFVLGTRNDRPIDQNSGSLEIESKGLPNDHESDLAPTHWHMVKALWTGIDMIGRRLKNFFEARID